MLHSDTSDTEDSMSLERLELFSRLAQDSPIISILFPNHRQFSEENYNSNLKILKLKLLCWENADPDHYRNVPFWSNKFSPNRFEGRAFPFHTLSDGILAEEMRSGVDKRLLASMDPMVGLKSSSGDTPYKPLTVVFRHTLQGLSVYNISIKTLRTRGIYTLKHTP